MPDDTKQSGEKQARLAAQLRANLRRRKEQARTQAAAADAVTPDSDPPAAART